MRASDLAAPFPVVVVTAPAVDAAPLLAGQSLPGLVVVDEPGSPVAVRPGTLVLRMVPAYATILARVVDGAAAYVFIGVDSGSMRDCLDTDRRESPVAVPDATVLATASLTARTGTPLVTVVDGHGQILGEIGLDAVLDRVVCA